MAKIEVHQSGGIESWVAGAEQEAREIAKLKAENAAGTESSAEALAIKEKNERRAVAEATIASVRQALKIIVDAQANCPKDSNGIPGTIHGRLVPAKEHLESAIQEIASPFPELGIPDIAPR